MTNPRPGEFPSSMEELGRKAIDVLSASIAKNAAGEVSDRELMLVAGALYDTVSGLVDWDEADVIAKVFNHLAGVPERERFKR